MSSKGNKYYLVIADYMAKIKDMIAENPNRGLSFNGTASVVARILMDKGVIVNCGNKPRPSYIWDDSYEINDKSAKEVTKIVRAMGTAWYKKCLSRAAAKKEESVVNTENKPVIEPVIEPVAKETPLDLNVEETVLLAVADMNKKPISEFSDAELWNELKARGYEAVSGFIQKTQVTTLH